MALKPRKNDTEAQEAYKRGDYKSGPDKLPTGKNPDRDGKTAEQKTDEKRRGGIFG